MKRNILLIALLNASVLADDWGFPVMYTGAASVPVGLGVAIVGLAQHDEGLVSAGTALGVVGAGMAVFGYATALNGSFRFGHEKQGITRQYAWNSRSATPALEELQRLGVDMEELDH